MTSRATRGDVRAWPDADGMRLAFGGDFNPEQWPRTTLREDVELMRAAGVTFVSVGVFSWANLEPEPGTYTLEWLAEVLDALHESGIGIDLATATASPPAWLHRAHPEVLPVDAFGRTLHFGSRQSWCPSSPVFRDHALRLVTRLAEAFGGHPGLRMWHAGNEYGNHNAQCFCPVSAAHFRGWLEQRHGDADGLNTAWSTDFWSQRYASIAQVEPPRLTGTFHNPAHVLDWRRFCSDAVLAAYRAEAEVLRDATPDVPVTTNFMVTRFVRDLDYARWAAHVDVVSNDHYLDSADPDAHVELAFSADLTRGLAGGAPWLLMEHSTSAVNWQRPRNRAKDPGEMARNSLAHVARGSDGAMFFQWRQSRGGAERFHSAMVPHAGPDSRVHQEVRELGARLEQLSGPGGLRGTVTQPADVALLFDTESWWALEDPALPTGEVDHREVALDVYGAFWRAQVAVDVVPPGADLDGRRVVVVPAMLLCDPAEAAALTAAAEAGAQVLVTFASALCDRHGRVGLGGYPAVLRDLLGVRATEFTPPAPGEAIEGTGGFRGGRWAEDTVATDATVLVEQVVGPRPGTALVTRVDRGAGAAWYVSTWPDRPSLDDLVGRVVRAAGVAAVATAPGGAPLAPGVEAVRRVGDDGRGFVFVVNHTDEDATVAVGERTLTVAAGAVEVVRS